MVPPLTEWKIQDGVPVEKKSVGKRIVVITSGLDEKIPAHGGVTVIRHGIHVSCMNNSAQGMMIRGVF